MPCQPHCAPPPRKRKEKLSHRSARLWASRHTGMPVPKGCTSARSRTPVELPHRRHLSALQGLGHSERVAPIDQPHGRNGTHYARVPSTLLWRGPPPHPAGWRYYLRIASRAHHKVSRPRTRLALNTVLRCPSRSVQIELECCVTFDAYGSNLTSSTYV